MSQHTMKSDALVLGAVVPTVGAAGLWGASTRACAELAVAEINSAGGVLGRELQLQLIEADEGFVSRVDSMVGAGQLDGVVAMHTSDTREPLRQAIAARVPYIYTPLYEGGEASTDVFCLGETPGQQLAPAVSWLGDTQRAKRWYLIGNDYVWPRRVHRQFKSLAKTEGLQVLGESYLPLGHSDYSALLERLKSLRPDGVLLSLVGQDNVMFNRAFAAAGLSSVSLRLSCALDESVLLGIGAASSERIFSVSGYFSTAKSRRNDCFKEKYHQHFGERCPPLNAIGHSVYEGVQFFEQLHREYDEGWRAQKGPMLLSGARGAVFDKGACEAPAMYLAEAEGLDLRVKQTFC